MDFKRRIKLLILNHKVDLMLFGISGLCAFAVDYSTLLFVDKLSHNLLIATTAGILTGFLASYTLNYLRFSKRHQETRSAKQSLPLFVILFLFNTAFTYTCLEINESHHLLPRLIVKMGTVGFIMIWNYILFHIFVFRNKVSSKGV